MCVSMRSSYSLPYPFLFQTLAARRLAASRDPDTSANIRFEGDVIEEDDLDSESPSQLGGSGAAAASSFASTVEKILAAEDDSDQKDIIAGTVDKLIEKLSSHLNYGFQKACFGYHCFIHPCSCTGQSFATEFLYTYRWFTTPSDLVRGLVSRYVAAEELAEFDEHTTTSIRLRFGMGLKIPPNSTRWLSGKI